MSAEFAVSERRLRDGIVLLVDGEIDMLTAPKLSAIVDAALRSDGVRRCVVDLSRVRFMSSAGIAMLQRAVNAADGNGVRLQVVVGAAQAVIRPLQVIGLLERLPVHTTLDEAVSA